MMQMSFCEKLVFDDCPLGNREHPITNSKVPQLWKTSNSWILPCKIRSNHANKENLKEIKLHYIGANV